MRATARALVGAYAAAFVDAEHAPNDVPLLVSQLQAMKGSASHAIIRPPIGETWIVKQLLDKRLYEHPGYFGEMIWISMMLEQWLRGHATSFSIKD